MADASRRAGARLVYVFIPPPSNRAAYGDLVERLKILLRKHGAEFVDVQAALTPDADELARDAARAAGAGLGLASRARTGAGAVATPQRATALAVPGPVASDRAGQRDRRGARASPGHGCAAMTARPRTLPLGHFPLTSSFGAGYDLVIRPERREPCTLDRESL